MGPVCEEGKKWTEDKSQSNVIVCIKTSLYELTIILMENEDVCKLHTEENH